MESLLKLRLIMFHIVVTISLITCASAALDLDNKLKRLNKPAFKSFKSVNGDIIDCVDIYKQPAFDHPLLKNHIIQMRPSHEVPIDSEASKTTKRTSRHSGSTEVTSQILEKGESCPNGTIPIRRIKRRDLLRASSIDRFGMKYPTVDLNNTKYNLQMANRSMSVLISEEKDYIGVSGEIGVWRPYVAEDDFSTGQLWLVGSTTDDFESIEAGWMVNPKLYGDIFPHFFVAWTKDSYRTTGCFDLTCPGFVQTIPTHIIGNMLKPWSLKNGGQFHINVGIFKDRKTSNWWVHFGEKDSLVGYWPSELFTQLKNSGPMVQWGGQVFSGKIYIVHTETQMGSGALAESKAGLAASVSRIRILDADDPTNKIFPFRTSVNNSEPRCYDGFLFEQGFIEDPVYFFGGPGRAPLCP